MQILELRDFLLMQHWKDILDPNNKADGGEGGEGPGGGECSSRVLTGGGLGNLTSHGSYGDLMKLSTIREMSLTAQERENEWSHVRRMVSNDNNAAQEAGVEDEEETAQGREEGDANMGGLYDDDADELREATRKRLRPETGHESQLN